MIVLILTFTANDKIFLSNCREIISGIHALLRCSLPINLLVGASYLNDFNYLLQ